jgi:hypothetical protein
VMLAVSTATYHSVGSVFSMAMIGRVRGRADCSTTLETTESPHGGGLSLGATSRQADWAARLREEKYWLRRHLGERAPAPSD